MSVLTAKAELVTPAAGDWIHIVDISDASGSPQGTSKKITTNNLATLFGANLFNSDGTISANRTVDIDGKTLSFINGAICFDALQGIKHINGADIYSLSFGAGGDPQISTFNTGSSETGTTKLNKKNIEYTYAPTGGGSVGTVFIAGDTTAILQPGSLAHANIGFLASVTGTAQINAGVGGSAVIASSSIQATVANYLYTDNLAIGIGTPTAKSHMCWPVAGNDVKAIWDGDDTGSFSIEGNFYLEQFSTKYRSGFGTTNTRQSHEFFWQGNVDTTMLSVNPSTGFMNWSSTDTNSLLQLGFDIFMSDANEFRFGGGATVGSAKYNNPGSNTDGSVVYATKIDGVYSNRWEIDERGGVLFGDVDNVSTSMLGMKNEVWVSRGGQPDAQLTSTTGTAGVSNATLLNTRFEKGYGIELLSGPQIGEIRRVTTFADDTNLTLETAFGANQTNVDIQILKNLIDIADHSGTVQFKSDYKGFFALGLGDGLPQERLDISGNFQTDANVEAATYSVAGAPGVDFGPSAVTSITVVKGLVTAIS